MLTKNVTDQNLSSPNRPQKKGKFEATLAALFITALIAGGIIFLKRAIKLYETPPAERLSKLISQDLENLKLKNSLPPEFKNLSEIEITTEGSTFKPWTDLIKLSIPQTASGTHTLQVFIFFYLNEKKYGANVQYDLVENKSENTIWELSRSYDLGWIF